MFFTTSSASSTSNVSFCQPPHDYNGRRVVVKAALMTERVAALSARLQAADA